MNLKLYYNSSIKSSDYFKQNATNSNFNKSDSWVILSPIEKRIKEKIEKIGVPLKDWDIQINYGIKTGFNDAFIIDGAKRKELIEQDPKSAEIIRPNSIIIQINKCIIHQIKTNRNTRLG